MTKQHIASKLSEIIITNFNVFENDISDQKTLEDLGLDSLDKLELSMLIEDHFNLRDRVNDGDMSMEITVSQLIDLIYNLKN